MKKNRTWFWGLSLYFMISFMSVAFCDEFDEFGDQMTLAWNATNNTQMLSLINNRLTTDSNDILGLACKTYYYAFGECNLTNARLTADQLYSVVEQKNDSDATAMCLEMKNEIFAIPLTESGPLSQMESEQVHALISSFPSLQKCLWLSKRLNTEQ